MSAPPHSEKHAPSCTCHADETSDADGDDYSAGVTRSQLWLVGISGLAIVLDFIASWR